MVKKTRAGMTVALVTICFLIGGIFLLLSSLATPATASIQVNPTPTQPGEALRQLQATENAILNTYGWVDRPNGVVRIPIDRAIEIIEQRGLPTRP
jgi:hypothetical protein